MAGGTIPSGISTYTGSITTGATAEATVFADRFGYVLVQNTGSAVLYVTADGSAPLGATDATGGSGVAVQPGGQSVLANGLPLWYPSSKVIPLGANQFGGGNTSDSAASPGMVQSQRSLAGQMANPGTKVTVLGATAAQTYTISGTG
jgi:hypothetical protein